MNLKPVLYAEDDQNDAFFLGRAFEQVEVANPLVIVSDGQEAIDYCLGAGCYSDREKHPLPCLALVDLKMPKKSGLEVLKSIRSEPSVSTLPIIVLTSSLHDADIHRAYIQGANAYLVKPSTPGELIVMVKNIKDFWLAQNRTAENHWNRFGPE